MGRIYVDKYTARLERSDIYYVNLILKDGTVIENLEPRRLFPFTNKNMFITLLDAEEKEVALIRDFDEVDPASRKVLEACFEDYYLIPEITKVNDVIVKNGTMKMWVETDRGSVSFQIRNRHHDIKAFQGTGRVIIRDFNDNRYEIKDYNKLDAKSKRLLYSDL